MRTLLLDADIPAYKFSSAVEAKYDWGDGVVSNNADLSHAQEAFKDYLEYLVDSLRADRVIVCLSDDEVNWRKGVLPSYKEQRTGERPSLLYPMKEWMLETYESFRRYALEADDVCGILSTHGHLIKGEKIIVSEDKDMASIPGLLYNPDHPKRGVIEIGQVDADYYHMLQTLTGDVVDNYTGCPGIGPVAAMEALGPLSDPRHMWEAVVEVYEDEGLTEADALQQARVARICRASDYDFKKKEVVLWKP